MTDINSRQKVKQRASRLNKRERAKFSNRPEPTTAPTPSPPTTNTHMYAKVCFCFCFCFCFYLLDGLFHQPRWMHFTPIVKIRWVSSAGTSCCNVDVVVWLVLLSCSPMTCQYCCSISTVVFVLLCNGHYYCWNTILLEYNWSYVILVFFHFSLSSCNAAASVL